jgi:hypothetical protein
MDDVPVDDESPIDQWIAVGYQRGVITGVLCSVMSAAILASIYWMTR